MKTAALTVLLTFLAAPSLAAVVQCSDGNENIETSLVSFQANYPESPLYTNGRLFFVEYGKNQVTVVHGANSKEPSAPTVFWSQSGCGPAAVTPFFSLQPDGVAQQNGFLIACYDNNALVRVSENGDTLAIYQKAGNENIKGPNDFAYAGSGNFYFTASGVFTTTAPIEGKIFHLNSDGIIKKVADGIHYSNGIGVTDQGRTLLVSEHLKNRILKYRILNKGSLSKEPKVFADLNRTVPFHHDLTGGLQGLDGMRVGKDGTVFVAQYGGSRIIKLNSKGELIGIISIEGVFSNTTNVWINETEIYISAVQETENPSNFGVVIRINDPKLYSRKQLTCKIL